MAYNEKLAERIRKSLAHLPKVEEKKMFRGVTFMVDGKMCISVGKNDMMCRIDPAIHKETIQKKGCRTVVMKGREYKGFILIKEEDIKTKKEFDYWIALSLLFNKKAKAAVKRKNTPA